MIFITMENLLRFFVFLIYQNELLLVFFSNKKNKGNQGCQNRFFFFLFLSTFIARYIIDALSSLLCHLATRMGTSQSHYRPQSNHSPQTYFTPIWGASHHHQSTPHGHHIRPAFGFGAPPPHLRRHR